MLGHVGWNKTRYT